MIVSLHEAKDHLRVDSDDENALIIGKITAAEAHLAAMIGRPLDEHDAEALPAIREAVLQLVAHWFDSRDAAPEERRHDLPHGLSEIIREQRDWSF